jgi:hypothetical protein
MTGAGAGAGRAGGRVAGAAGAAVVVETGSAKKFGAYARVHFFTCNFKPKRANKT